MTLVPKMTCTVYEEVTVNDIKVICKVSHFSMVKYSI